MALAASTAAALEPAEVLVLVNRDVSESSRIASFYMAARNVPPGNILRLPLGTNRDISREQYRTRIAAVVKKRLQEDPQLRCILTTPGFPYLVSNSAPDKQDGAAIDNELAGVLRDEPADLNRWQPNPLYLRGDNLYGIADPRAFQMVYVARLEGPGISIVTRMIEDAIAAEKSGLQGPVFGDTMGSETNIGTAATDTAIRAAIDRLSGAGYRPTLDMSPETWKAPAGGVGEQAAGAAFYVGWYSLQTFQDIFGRQGLARGAIAWHIASGEAGSPWSSTTNEWCPNLLRRGAAVTIGPAFEPYLAAFPKADIFVEQLLAGRSVAESYWQALPFYSWAMVLLGDPLYRPFAQPRPALVTRSYTAASRGRVLHAGETAPLLVRVQCVGAPGSATPALSAHAEAGYGLKHASGKVLIPALKAGESAVVAVPDVQAGTDPTGLFRLNLDVDESGELSRRIVVEGRAGFSLLARTAARQIQMFPSPKGTFLVGGAPAAPFLIETATLDAKSIPIPTGWGLAAAAFSPDESHLVLTFVQPQQKQMLSVLTDLAMKAMKQLPADKQFIRWQTADKLLLKGGDSLFEYSIPLAAALPIAARDGWQAGIMIAGTDIVALRNAAGAWAVRQGAAQPRPVLEGTAVVRDVAIADDLSNFGGVDAQNRLWVQHGFDARPEVLAEHVGRVLWGPISRRAVVQSSTGEIRIYDSSTKTWSPLGTVAAGTWSGDEKRFLHVTMKASGPESLVLWDDGRLQNLCPMDRLGDMAAPALSNRGDLAFLLAGPDGGLQIWVLPLPTGK